MSQAAHDICESAGRCATARVQTVDRFTFLCHRCNRVVPRTSPRIPAEYRLKARASKPRKHRRYPTSSHDRTRVNGPAFGRHPATVPQTVWW